MECIVPPTPPGTELVVEQCRVGTFFSGAEVFSPAD
jgi:hypothetical protein